MNALINPIDNELQQLIVNGQDAAVTEKPTAALDEGDIAFLSAIFANGIQSDERFVWD